MINAAELKADYRLIHGDPANIEGRMQRADLHLHISDGDSTDTAGRMVHAAVAQGLDAIAVTNHDNLRGYDSSSRIRDERRYPLQVIKATEITASPTSGERSNAHRHVLVFEPKKVRDFPVGIPLRRLLDTAYTHGSIVSIAHPELGDFSSREKELEDLLTGDIPPFGIEIHNGGASQIDRYKQIPLPAFIRRLIPDPGSNDRARTIFEKLRTGLQGATGGSDAHNARHVGDVVTCYPEDMDVFEAIRSGKSVVMERKRLPRATVTNVAIGTIRGRLLERKRRKGLGVEKYDPSFIM